LPRFGLFREAAVHWSNHNAPRLGAALAYYSVLSLAPILILLVALAGRFFGDQTVRGQVYWQIRQVTGEQSAAVVLSLLEGAQRPKGFVPGLLGLITLMVGASGVFVELRDALNYIWSAPPREHSAWRTILRDRFFSFAIVLGIGFLLAVSLVASSVVHALEPDIISPGRIPSWVNLSVTFVGTWFLFAVIYRIVPEVRVDWTDVVIGSAITAVLFSIGKSLIGLYLGKAAVGSAYGAAGSLVALLVWVYYSAQIFLYGAEFTHVYASSRRPVPDPPA
jgi:membrane protein